MCCRAAEIASEATPMLRLDDPLGGQETEEDPELEGEEGVPQELDASSSDEGEEGGAAEQQGEAAAQAAAQEAQPAGPVTAEVVGPLLTRWAAVGPNRGQLVRFALQAVWKVHGRPAPQGVRSPSMSAAQ